jgi:hypothetical protein
VPEKNAIFAPVAESYILAPPPERIATTEPSGEIFAPQMGPLLSEFAVFISDITFVITEPKPAVLEYKKHTQVRFRVHYIVVPRLWRAFRLLFPEAICQLSHKKSESRRGLGPPEPLRLEILHDRPLAIRRLREVQM